MGAITRIRQLSPFVLGTMAVAFIVYMVVSDQNLDFLKGNTNDATRVAVAEVNGEVISQFAYENKVREILENMRARNNAMEAQGQPTQEINDGQVREQVFEQMVNEILMRQQVEKMGLTITDDEIASMMLNEPPQGLQQWFTDSSGRFDKAMYQRFATNPDELESFLQQQNRQAEEIAEIKSTFIKALTESEVMLRVQKLQEALSTTVNAAMSIPSPAHTALDYQMNNSTADVRYVVVMDNTTIDSTIAVSDKEVADYYAKNQKYYVQKPQRKIKYAVFQDVPSAKDTAAAVARSARVMEVFGRLMDVPSRDSAFTEFMSEYGGVTNDFKMLSDIDENTRMVLMGTSEHDVFGPLNMPDGIKYYRVDQRREGANPQVRASHILFDFGTNKDSARAVAENVLARARKGEDFGMLAMTNSKDVGSARQQGDLGYFGKGRMVAEFEKAAFDAQVGEIVGPVESQFGYHIIKVTDKQNTEIKYSEISIAPRISNITKQAMLANSAKMEERVTDGAQFDTVAKSYNLPVSESKFFSARTPVINSAELTAWAFAASKGDVTRVDVENMGMVIAQLVEVREKGLKPLEDMKEEILQTLRLNKKVDRLKAKAEQVAQACKAAGSIDAARSIDSTLEVRIQTGLLDNGQLTGFAGDFTVSHAAFTLPIGQVGNAVRGKRAWFVMVVDQRTVADMAAFKQNAPTHYQALSAKDRQNAFYTWYQNIRDNANIVDKRWDRNQ